MLISLLAIQLDPLFGFVLVIGVIYLIGQLFLEEVQKYKRQQFWSEISTTLQGKYTSHSNHSPIGELKTRIQNTPITIDGATQLTPFPFVCTRISTPVSMPRDFSLILSPESTIDSLGKVLGGQDIILGDASFDRAFIVRSNNELLCRLWLNAMTRPLLLLSEKYRYIAVKDGSFMMVRIGNEIEQAPLKQAAEICAKLGKHATKLSENWQSLAKRFQGKIKNATSPEPLPHNTELELSYQGRRYIVSLVLDQQAGVLTQLSTQHTSKIGPFSIAPAGYPVEPKPHQLSIVEMPTKYQVLANNKEDAERTINQRVTQPIQQITPYAIVASAQSIEILLPGFVYTPETIQTALELANHFISPSDGPYR